MKRECKSEYDKMERKMKENWMKNMNEWIIGKSKRKTKWKRFERVKDGMIKKKLAGRKN